MHRHKASQFLFLYSLKDMAPPNEACLYGCIKWSLVQAQKQSSMGSSQSFPPLRGGKARPRTQFHFNMQREPCRNLLMPLLQIDLAWRVGLGPVKVAESLLLVVSLPLVLALGTWGAVEVSIPDVLQSTALSSSSSLLYRLVHIPIF